MARTIVPTDALMRPIAEFSLGLRVGNVVYVGATAGTDYDQLAVTGSATLGNATLNLTGSRTPAPGDAYTIVTTTTGVTPADIAGRPLFAAFPDSEINISPVEGTAGGKAVIDVSIMSIGITMYDPVTLFIKGGRIVDMQGGVAAKKFRQTLDALENEKAFNYAEFGIGLNPCARLCATNLEDLGRLGNCHCGIGSSFAIGGKILAPNHHDAMFKDASVYFDGKLVLDKGVCKI